MLSHNSCKTEFLLIGLKPQLAKIQQCYASIDTTQSARNLCFIFDEHLSFSDQVSALSKSCYHHIRALRCIRPYLDVHTAETIATSIVHSRLDYCNSLYYGLPTYQINHLQHIENALAWTVVQAPHHSYSEIFSLALSSWMNWIREFSLLMVTTCTFHLTSLTDQTIFITQSHSPLLPTCFTLFLKPASYITQNSSTELFILLLATFIWTCQFNLLHTAITFHHFCTVSLWAQNLPFQKILSSTLVSSCLFLSVGLISWL